MGAATLLQGEAQQFMFQHTIHPTCLAAQQRGQDMLEPHCCKVAVMERIVDLHRVLPDLLDTMLGNLLAESPDTDRLHYILEHINYWILFRVSQERASAIRSSTALLRFTITLPEFDNSAKVPRLGHRVAQLALFISDPGKDLSQQAREGVY
ncbi:maestro heat-like repeat-containing protein family member 7 [Pangshura tecta]